MSQTTQVKGAKIRDGSLIEKAVVLLQEKGIKCTLHRNQIPKMYFPHQETGARGVGSCEYVIELHGQSRRLDLGFKLVDGEYQPVFDDHADIIRNIIGRPYECGDNSTSRQLGNISQFNIAYNMALVMENYAEEDVSYEQLVNQDGSISMVVTMEEQSTGMGY